jgi:hypothetical protein
MPFSAASFAQRLILLVALVSVSRSDARPPEPYFDGGFIRFDASINSQPASLFYDTGASATALFAGGAERLRISFEASHEVMLAGRKVATGQSKEVDFKMLGSDARTRFTILPFRHRLDGVLGWRSVRTPLLMDGLEQRVRPLDKPPSDPGWQKWKIEQENPQLFFALTDGAKPMGRVFVDTGVTAGLRLSPALWKAWKSSHPENPITLETFRYPVGEVMVSEVAWVAEFRLGDLVFYHVDIGSIPSSKDGIATDAGGKEFIATIGTGALRHLHLVVSTGTGEIWTRSVSGVPAHNRLGAVFLPVSANDPRLACRVLPNTPATESGLLEGDVLTGIEGIDESDFAKANHNRLNQIFSQPAGTELKLRVYRAGSTVEVRAKLRDILNTRPHLQNRVPGSD